MQEIIDWAIRRKARKRQALWHSLNGIVISGFLLYSAMYVSQGPRKNNQETIVIAMMVAVVTVYKVIKAIKNGGKEKTKQAPPDKEEFHWKGSEESHSTIMSQKGEALAEVAPSNTIETRPQKSKLSHPITPSDAQRTPE